MTLTGMLAGYRRALVGPLVRRMPWWLSTIHERVVFYAGISAVWSLLLALGKGALLLHTPSPFLLANALFTLGISAAKGVTVFRHRRTHTAITPEHNHDVHHRTARWVGVILSVSAGTYLGLCLPLLLGNRDAPLFNEPTAILLAAIAFTDLGIAIVGAARTSRVQPLLATTRRINLVNAVILIVLAQAAILSFTATDPYTIGLGISAMGLGILALTAGLGLLLPRSRRREPSLTRCRKTKASHERQH